MSWLWNILSRVAQAGIRAFLKEQSRPKRTQRRKTTSRSSTTDYPGDYRGIPKMVYAPHAGDSADTGEVVWTWVPFEEDYSRGKDRPVLVIGSDNDWLLALPLTSKDHDRDAAQEASEHRYWVDLGTGPWDQRGKASEVRVNRIIRVDPNKVRRIGGVIPKDTFTRVVTAVHQHAAS
ncbi:MAG: type II toxin-antitoxin system PemK/MazF family toxin [Propionibacteriaceae bacterium]